VYVTGDVDAAYLNRIEAARSDVNKKQKPPNSSTQLDLNLLSTDAVGVD
jgi:amidophosphoribosyltransferase